MAEGSVSVARRPEMSSLAARMTMIAITMASAVTVAVLASLLMPKVYQSSTEFYLVTESPALGMLSRLGAAAAGAPLLAKETERWFVGILESAAVRERVSRAVPQKSPMELDDDVDVEITRNHIFRISVRDKDPLAAASIANAYPPALREFLRSASMARSQRTGEANQASLAELDQLVVQAQRETETMLAGQHAPSVQAEMQRLLQRKAALESEIENARALLDGIEQRIGVASEQLNQEGARIGALASPNQQRLLKDVSDLEADLAAASAEFDGKYSERHPKIKALRARVQQKQAELERERVALGQAEVKPADTFHEQLRREIMGLYKDRSAAKAEMISSTRSLATLVSRIGKLLPNMLREQETASAITRLERMRDTILLRDRDNRLASASEPSPIVVVAHSEPATTPKYPRLWLNAAVAALLGLIGGTGLALRHRASAEA